MKHLISINLLKESCQKNIIVRQRDTSAHTIIINLTEGTKPFKFPENSHAVMYGIKPDGKKIFNDCEIINNQIIYKVTTQTLSCSGVVECEVHVTTPLQEFTVPKFLITVEDVNAVPHFELLENEPDNWVDYADTYYKYDDITKEYSPVEFDSKRDLLADITFHADSLKEGYYTSPRIPINEGQKICISKKDAKIIKVYVTLWYCGENGNTIHSVTNSEDISTGKTFTYTAPTISKRNRVEKGYSYLIIYISIPESSINNNKAVDIMAEYDSKTYFGCKTPYFEKGKYYALVDGTSNSKDEYNAILEALRKAQEYSRKAIKSITTVNNCIVITYQDNSQYISPNLKGVGIINIEQTAKKNNIDYYTITLSDNTTYEFSVTNCDNEVLLKLQNDSHSHNNKSVLDSINQSDIDYWNSKVNSADLETLESTENKITEINFPSTNYYPTSGAVWNYVNSKQDELHNTFNLSIEEAKGLIPTKVSQLTNDKGYINNIDVRGADFTSPVFLQTQKEGTTLAFYAARAFSETPSDSKTYTSNYINQLLESKAENEDLVNLEDKNNKIDEINFPSTNFYTSAKAVWDYVNSKQEEINTLISAAITSMLTNNSGGYNESLIERYVDNVEFDTVNNKMTIWLYFKLPTNCTILSSGAILTNDEAVGSIMTYDGFNKDNAQFFVHQDSEATNITRYYVRKKDVFPGDTWYIKPYLKYKINDTSEEFECYSAFPYKITRPADVAAKSEIPTKLSDLTDVESGNCNLTVNHVGTGDPVAKSVTAKYQRTGNVVTVYGQAVLNTVVPTGDYYDRLVGLPYPAAKFNGNTPKSLSNCYSKYGKGLLIGNDDLVNCLVLKLQQEVKTEGDFVNFTVTYMT